MPKFNINDVVVCKSRVGVNIFAVMKIFYIDGALRKPTYFDVTGVSYKEDELALYGHGKNTEPKGMNSQDTFGDKSWRD